MTNHSGDADDRVERLKPCPWCGGTISGTVVEADTFRWRKMQGCCGDGPEVRHNTLADDQAAAEVDSRERAIAAWNTRVQSTQDDGLLGELEKLADNLNRDSNLLQDSVGIGLSHTANAIRQLIAKYRGK